MDNATFSAREFLSPDPSTLDSVAASVATEVDDSGKGVFVSIDADFTLGAGSSIANLDFSTYGTLSNASEVKAGLDANDHRVQVFLDFVTDFASNYFQASLEMRALLNEGSV